MGSMISIINIEEWLVFDLNFMSKKNDPKNSKIRELINEAYEQNELDSLLSTRHRARSITVGTAFGGIPEITLRSESGYIYAQMQPVEVIELIEQLAAGCGIEIAMRPKQNFASWRGWEEIIDQRIGFDKIAWKGAAAWQLDGSHLEKNIQNKLNPAYCNEESYLPGSEESTEEVNIEKKQSVSNSTNKPIKSRSKSKKVSKKEEKIDE